jgi:dihydroorotate dehydrogenase (fumarate)
VNGFVLFNRFMHPTIDTMTMKPEYGNQLSDPLDNRIPLRYTGLLYGRIGSDICASGGIHSGEDAAKLILAGASAVQTVSALYAKGIGYLETMKRDLNDWMDTKGFSGISDIKGKLSAKNLADPDAYSRSQYIKMLTIPKRDQM